MFYEFKIDFGNGFETVPQPLNHSAIKVELAFTSQTPSASIQSVAFEWVGDTAKRINDYVNGGQTGSTYGIGEGLPLQILICNTQIGFDLILDLNNSAALFECDKVVCPIKQVGGVDWLSTLSAGFSFWYLAGALTDSVNGYGGSAWVGPAPGKINISDFKKTPYVITTIPDFTQVMILLVSDLGILFQIKTTIELIAKDGEMLIGDLGNIGGSLLAILGAIAKAIADLAIVILEVAYLVILVALLINTTIKMFDNIIQVKKYKLCMREKDLFIRACQYMGLNFSSTIYANGSPFENSTWMPKKILMPNINQNVIDFLAPELFERPADESHNSQAYGYYDGGVQQFIKDMCTKYNASMVVINGTAHFEEVHYWNNQTPFVIQNISDLGYVFNTPDPHGTNMQECPAALMLEFQTDTSDLNTVQKYRGTTCQVTVTPQRIGNMLHLLTPPGQVIILPCAMGKRKDYLTQAEALCQKIITDINAVINAFSDITKLENDVNKLAKWVGFSPPFNTVQNAPNFYTKYSISGFNDRFGWLELSDDSFSVPKSFIGYDDNGDWKLTSDSEEVMSAVNLMNNFHGKNLLSRGNQYLTYSNRKFPFCCKDFLQILNNNIIQLPSGKLGKITKLIWNLEQEIAEQVDYRINSNFTNNYSETVIIDGAQA